jgi:hypothetical protein
MSSSPTPTALEKLGKRPFSFYPPVLNIEHNEWLFERATWSEVLVANTKTQVEVWVPRRFLGEVSRVDEPVMIVGLRKELEYKAGSLWPHERRVIEMPRGVQEAPFGDSGEPVAAPPSAPPAGMRLGGGAESRIGLLIGAALLVGILACFLVVSVFRGRTDGPVTWIPVMQQPLGLTPEDDVHAVMRKLGPPAQDRWRSETGELQYRILVYPQRSLSIILMGKDRESARYIGAMDGNWKPIDAVDLPHAGNTRSMLNRLARF